MPWALLIRAIARVAAALFFWRVATSRRGAYRTAGGDAARPVAPPPSPSRLRGRGAAAAIREGALVGWRVASLAAFLIAAVVLLIGGVTLTLLSPRWLGGVLLALAALAIAWAFIEGRIVYALVAARRRRRHGEQLIRGL